MARFRNSSHLLAARAGASLVTSVALSILAGALGAEPLELGIPLPLTGAQAKFGEIQRRSYELAAEEINKAGGVKGRPLVLTFEDSGGRPEVARSIAEKLIDVKKQPLVLGEYSSSCSKAVAAVAEERKVPYLVVTGAADDITQQNYRYVFRLNPSSASYAAGLISFLRDVVKPRTVAILYESSDFGSSGADDMENQAKGLGMEVVLKEKYEKGAVDFKPILSRVKARSPDVLYMVSYVMDAALLMQQIKELRIDARLFAGGAAGFAIPEFIGNAREASEYVVTATLWSTQSTYPGSREFVTSYRSRHGAEPSYHGAEAYAAVYVVKDVVTRARTMSSEDLREAFKATDLMSAFGPVKFQDRDGFQNQNFMDTLVLQVISGQLETVWPKKYASKDHVFPIPRWRDRNGHESHGNEPMAAVQVEVFVQTLLSGILLGGLYALIGIGMTLIMGVMRIINLAHGELMMVSMYISFFLFETCHMDPYLSIVIVVPIMFLLGVAIQKFLMNPVLTVESILPENQVILTVGLGMVLSNVATLLFSSNYRSTPVSYSTKAWYLSDLWEATPVEISLSFSWTVSFLVAVALTTALWLFLTRTDTGKSIRATAQDPGAATLMGVNVGHMRVLTFGLGTALVGAAGCLFLPMYYLYPSLGGQFTLIAFVVTVIGGLGSTGGAVLGGVILGIFEAMTSTYLGMGWAPVGRFLVFIAALIFLPRGVVSLLEARGSRAR